MVWNHTISPSPKKAQAVKSMGKVMFIVFIEMNVVILVHMARPGDTVNPSYYTQATTNII
mgnify:CR=1 FL=1